MTDITIPPEALEAAARVLHANLELFEDLPWEDLSDEDQEEYLAQARAACLAMLKAWPGMGIDIEMVGVEGDYYLILFLTTENTND
jgi:hypothetical protein